MREIKFRLWDKKCRVMFEHRDISVGGEIEYRQFPNEIYRIRHDGHNSPSEQDFELMQYTGLKDKNGKEIYEGDILAVGKLLVLGQVMFRPTDGFWATKDNHNFYRIDGDSVYIIGNIYENPELLEDETPLT